ncbi:unnamed protein product, partial [Laminaria digitata]
VGLLIDLKFIADNLSTVLVLLLIVTLFKTAMNIGIMRLMGESWQSASLQGLTLSQLGEFSFLLAATGLSAGAIGQEQSRLVIAVTVLSLAISPLWLTTARRVHGLASRRINTLRELVDAAYGDEVQVVRRRSRRLAIAGRIIARSTWNRAATRFPPLARIRKPHRPAPDGTKLLTGPDSPEGDSGPNSTAADSAPRKNGTPTEDIAKSEADRKDTLTELGKQVRAASKEDTSPSTDKKTDA